MKLEHDVFVHLPDKDWDLPNLTNSVKDDAFSFVGVRHFSDSTIHYHYACETTASVVPVARVDAYLKRSQGDVPTP